MRLRLCTLVTIKTHHWNWSTPASTEYLHEILTLRYVLDDRPVKKAPPLRDSLSATPICWTNYKRCRQQRSTDWFIGQFFRSAPKFASSYSTHWRQCNPYLLTFRASKRDFRSWSHRSTMIATKSTASNDAWSWTRVCREAAPSRISGDIYGIVPTSDVANRALLIIINEQRTGNATFNYGRRNHCSRASSQI